MRLTDRSISSLKPALPAGKDECIFFDSDTAGFGLRVRKSGSRSWVFQYWHGGKARRMTLGPWPKVTAAQARAMVGPLAAEVALGRDPGEAKFESRAAKMTFGTVAERYLAAKSKHLRPRSLVEVTRHLKVNAEPLHSISIEALHRRDVADLLTTLATSKGAVQANRTRASISAMMNWATKQGLAEANPAAFTSKEKETSRSRVLTESELAEIWRALPAGDYGAIVRLLILTAQRREEIAGLRWREIDMKRGTITLPPARVKNAREHCIPMSEPVKAIIAAIPKTDRDFVFGIREGGFCGWTKSKERLDAKLPKLEHWTLHDIRRTVATGMAEIGVAPHIIEATLNHASGHKAGVAGIYNRSTYEPEKREALDKWARYIKRTVSGLAVVKP
jgi:integrase